MRTRVTEDWRVVMAGMPGAKPPTINLDSNYYKLVDQLDDMLRAGVPSLRDCQELTVQGPVRLGPANVFRGRVSVVNETGEALTLPPGEYRDCLRKL